MLEEIIGLSRAIAANPALLPWNPMYKIALMGQQIGKETKDAQGVDWNRVERGFIPTRYEFDPQTSEPYARAIMTMEFWKSLDQHHDYDQANLSADAASALASLAYLLEETRWSGFLGTTWSEIRENLVTSYRQAGVPLAL